MTETSNNPEEEPASEANFIDLANELGLAKTTEMRSIREGLAPIEENREQFVENLTKYQKAGKEEVDKHDDTSRSRAQVGLIIATAALYRKVRMHGDYEESMQDAITYVHQILQDDDLVRKLELILAT